MRGGGARRQPMKTMTHAQDLTDDAGNCVHAQVHKAHVHLAQTATRRRDAMLTKTKSIEKTRMHMRSRRETHIAIVQHEETNDTKRWGVM